MCKVNINEWFLEKNLKYLEARRPTDSAIPRSGDKAKSVNCHVVFLTHEDIKGNEGALFDSYDRINKALTVRTRESSSKAYKNKTTVSLKGIKSMEVTHFYGHYDLKYDSYWQWVFEGRTKWDTFKVWAYYRHKNNITRFASYFSKMNMTNGRMEVLKHAVDLKVKHDSRESFSFRDQFQFSIYDIATSMYGSSFLYRADTEEFQSTLKICLDSLLVEGDLDKGYSIYYKVGKSAMKTLDEYERDNTRHKDSRLLSNGMFFLTAILALSALIQAGLIKSPVLLDLTGKQGGVLNDFWDCLNAMYVHLKG